MIFKGDVGLYATSTKFCVPAQSVNDETDYSGIVGGGTGGWVLGSSLIGHKVILVVNTGAAGNSPTGLTVGLTSASDANGTGAAFVSGKSTEYTASLASNTRTYEIDLSGLTSTTYYCPAVAVKGGGTATLLCSVTALFADPAHV